MKNLFPREIWALHQQQPGVLFTEVRMEIERQYVGRPALRGQVGAWRFDGLPKAQF